MAGEPPRDDERPITRLRIPPEMIIDPDNPRYQPPKPDPVLIALSVISAVSWLLVVAALLFVLRAQPESTNLFRLYLPNAEQELQKSWRSDLLQVAFYIMLANFVLTVAGTCVRICKKKPFNRSAAAPLVLGILSLVMAVVLFLFW